MPEDVKTSEILTGNDLGKLGNVEALPENGEIEAFFKSNKEEAGLIKSGDTKKIHMRAQAYLEEDRPEDAWKILLAK
ncbi:MAG TPA: hypothetical protein VJ973_08760, partial [Christiangramia sp.]|nr:hypothetical protein [Christiangramia sp.]